MITSPSLWGMMKDETDNNVWRLVGSGAPTNGTSGTGVAIVAGKGSTYIDIATGYSYRNTGTAASPVWETSSVNGITGDTTFSAGVATLDNRLVQRASGSISAANIIATGAGALGHANGVILLAAPGAGVAWELVSFGLYYTFGVAAYTAGGNLTVNWGAGGAALTGIVSAANSLGAASSKALLFNRLSTVSIPIVSNAPLNLVAATAFTNPGTATGTVAWELWYRKLTVGF